MGDIQPDIDAEIRRDFTGVEAQFLSAVQSNGLILFNDSLSALHRRFAAALQAQVLEKQTITIAHLVIQRFTTITQTLIACELGNQDTRERLLSVCTDTLDKAGFVAKPPRPRTHKVGKRSKSKKPSLQKKRAPTEPPKNSAGGSGGKKRKDTGVPGQESLKFRPCRDFFMDHLSDPYPTAAQKSEIIRGTDITLNSLNLWFTNIRRRSGWMTIMKEHAKGQKEAMKDLVERALLPNPPSSIPEKALQDVLKMRKYVDEQAREVFSEGFQEIVQIQPMTDQELKEWREERRIMRRKKMEEKKERAALELRQKAEEEERQRQAAGDVERAKRHKEKEARRARKVARREERARRMAAGLPVEPSRKRRRPADGDDERAGRKRARVVVDGTGVDKAHRRSKRSADGAHLSADGQRRRRRRKQHATQHPGTRGIPTVPYPSQPVPSSATKGKRRADDGAAPHPKRHCTNDWATPHIPDDNDNLTLRFDWDVPASTPAYTPASGTTTAVASPDATWTMHGADARNMSCTWPAASQAPLLNSGSTAMAGATPRSTETELGFDYWKQALSHMKQSATPEAAVFEVELPSEDHHYHQSVTPEPQSQHHSQTPHHSQSQSHSHSQERLENPHPRSAGDFPDYLDKISEYSGTGRSSQCATPVSSEDIFAPEPIPPYSSDDASSQPSSRAPSPRTGTYGLPPISEGYSVSEGTPSVSSHSHSRSSRQQGQQEQHQHQHQHQQGHDRQQRHVSQQPQLHQHPNPHHSHPHSHSQPPPSSQPRSHSQPHSHSQPQQQHQQQRHPLPPMPSFPSLPPLPSLPSLPPLPPLPPPPPPPPPASDDLHPDEIRRLFSQQAQFAARQAEHAKQQMELYHKAVMEWEERAAQMALRVNDPYLMSQAGMAAGAGGAAAGTGGPGGGGGEGVSY